MQTTTITAIVAHLVEVVEGITPTADPTTPGFVLSRAPNRVPLRRWVPEAGGNTMFRRFELGRASDREDGGINNFGARLATVTLRLTVAYPANPKLFGLDEFFDLEALIEEDAHQIHDAVSFPGGIAAAGHQATYPHIEALDQGSEDVWFQDLSIPVLAYLAKRTT